MRCLDSWMAQKRYQTEVTIFLAVTRHVLQRTLARLSFKAKAYFSIKDSVTLAEESTFEQRISIVLLVSM